MTKTTSLTPLPLKELIENVKYYTHDFWEIYGDNRVSRLPLLNSGPWHVLTLTAFYLYFVKVYGPQMMKNRQPMNLKWIMFIHNVTLVLINGLGFITALFGTHFFVLTFKCNRFDPSGPKMEDRILFYLGYTYYCTKFIDFLDTVYFVLRKKNSHISTLHVFHHSIMPIMCYIFFKFSVFTNNGFIPMINAFVHTIMYTYYCLAIFEKMQPYLWWKRYITQMQLVQFVLVFLHSTYFLFDSECECPKPLIFLQSAHAVLFFSMFYSFYRIAYRKEQKLKEKAKSVNDKPDHQNHQTNHQTNNQVNELEMKPKDV